MRVRSNRATSAVLAIGMLWTMGCASLNKSEKGLLVGAAGGAVVGGAIGKAAGSTAKGAIIGAAVGGAAGAIIGRQMDKQAEELAAEIPGAKVERVGEGVLVTFDSGLLFDFDSDVVKGAAQANLTELAKSLSRYTESDVLIVGHTDAVGTDSYNQQLSERRSRSAANFLVSRGVNRDRIDTAGRGEMEPVADNTDEAGRSQNRRVEVAIFASEEYRERLMKGNTR
ncbi:MAG: OmpA family protein [Gemmatimonadetes bacterium]|nr:OmpA family protein [Gemmatimonadota bacterium]